MGHKHEYTNCARLVAGYRNTISSPNASVSGGTQSTVGGADASVSWGQENLAGFDYSIVIGGIGNSTLWQHDIAP